MSGAGGIRPSDVGGLLASRLRDVPDWPQPGVVFKDITPLLADPVALRACLDALLEPVRGEVDVVAGIEARGFILGAPMALDLGVSFVPVRKAGKLPGATRGTDYDLEYGSARIEVAADAITTGDRVLVVDDLLATGGTAEAACRLVEECGGTVSRVAALVELSFLPWRERLAGRDVTVLHSV